MSRLVVCGCLVFFLGCGKGTPPETRVRGLAHECSDLGRTDCEARLVARAAAKAPLRRSNEAPRGFWAKLRHPTRAEMTTTAGRLQYWAHVGQAQRGELATVDTAKMAELLPRLQARIAEVANVPTSQVSVQVGVSAIRVKFQEGAIGTSSDGRPAGYCAPGMFAPALMRGMSRELLAANVRGVMCTSDRCGGMYNLRPESAGTLVLDGDACPGIDELLRADLGR